MSELSDTKRRSIKELKEFIGKAGLSFADCIDRPDLEKRAQEAERRLQQAAGQPHASQSLYSQGLLAGFHYKIAQTLPSQPISAIFLILHGFGATNDDFLPLVDAFKTHTSLTNSNLLCVFPQAPVNNLSRCAAWWDLNPMELLQVFQGGSGNNDQAIASVIRKEPNLLKANRTQLLQLLEELTKVYDCFDTVAQKPKVPLILGGFSQGAMTALDLAIHLPQQLVSERNKIAVISLSGAPIIIDQWHRSLEQLPQRNTTLSCFLTHGKGDFVIPFVAHSWLSQLLENYKSYGVRVLSEVHQGGHELGGQQVISKLCTFIATFLQA